MGFLLLTHDVSDFSTILQDDIIDQLKQPDGRDICMHHVPFASGPCPHGMIVRHGKKGSMLGGCNEKPSGQKSRSEVAQHEG